MAFKKIFLKYVLLGFLIFLAILAIIVFVLSGRVTNESETVKINFHNQIINAEIARSPYKIYNGLSNRQSLCLDCGLLFIFSDLDQRTFVMRDMLFPLDIIFIAKGQVLKIYENLAPEGANPQNLYNSEFPADQVLEINAGQAKIWGIKVGDELIID
ncbi:MAG TPA: DUF192 domain-containing protein [Candidatus Saccharimonadales bacterium]|nr:DUF192 domain-containing protein [Candidatus Saccharimonadales bacterium]